MSPTEPTTVENLRKKAIKYLWHWLGTPYSWGGQDFSSFDCSGLAHEVLQSVGIEEHNFDSTAHDLYLKFIDYKVDKPYAGCLVFWFRDGRAVHVEMLIDDFLVIGASGGGSSVKTLRDAIRQNAFVKMRPLKYRGENFKIIDPFLSLLK